VYYVRYTRTIHSGQCCNLYRACVGLTPFRPQNCPFTSGQSNLTKDRIAAAHGRFSRIRQMAAMCTHLVHQSRQPNRITVLALLSRFEYIDRRTCPGMCWADPFSPSKLPFHVWDLNPRIMAVPWAHPSPHPKQHLGRFSLFLQGPWS